MRDCSEIEFFIINEKKNTSPTAQNVAKNINLNKIFLKKVSEKNYSESVSTKALFISFQC